MPGSQPTFERTLADYFRERLHDEGAELNPIPQEDTLWYMGNMLARFGDSDQLFCYDEGELGIRPLAMLYKDAHEANDHRERCLILRQLGDVALFVGALFPESYARRGILKDYFVGMGGGAYGYLSENAHQNRHVFSELASTFTRMLELVARVCSKETQFDAGDILSLYQRWRRNQDPRLEEQLRALGIVVAGDDRIH
ncbi:hypothetical protein FHR99_001646 [Litorivivens lipolytica]|uniref:Uncharacterized protein n=1 Tax=Litorivivens lipolytica TaxID=1524264 RepID=A0A7W4W4Q6_9GAMM|nr:hypothetical protein [Litorivivens lipolytica]MBB3047410.1 hypothetical protein [Litorivivens lipolytica]